MYKPNKMAVFQNPNMHTVAERIEYVRNVMGFFPTTTDAIESVLDIHDFKRICSRTAINYVNGIITCYISMTSPHGYEDYCPKTGVIMYSGEGKPEKGDQKATSYGNSLLIPNNAVLVLVCAGEGQWFFRTGVRVTGSTYGWCEKTKRMVFHFKIKLV